MIKHQKLFDELLPILAGALNGGTVYALARKSMGIEALEERVKTLEKIVEGIER